MSKQKSGRQPEDRREADTAREKTSLRSRMRDPVTRQKIAMVLIGLGVVIFAQHWVSHLGFFTLISGSADDLLVGYPTAGVLVVTGLMMLPGTDKKGR